LPRWQRWALRAPDRLSGSVANLIAGAPFFAINGLYVPRDNSDAALDDAKREFRRLLHGGFLDRVRPRRPALVSVEAMSFADAAAELGAEVPTTPFTKAHANFAFTRLRSAGWRRLFDYLRTPAIPDDPFRVFAALQFLAYGGAVNRVPPEASVMVARRGTVAWTQNAVAWSQQADNAVALAYSAGLQRIVQSLVSPLSYYGYADDDLGADYMRRYFGPYVAFLERTKAKYDPANFFRFTQSIPLPRLPAHGADDDKDD
jgi:hypothetical protein